MPGRGHDGSTPRLRQSLGLVALLMLCYLVMVIGALWTDSATGRWYQGLSRPSWTPPGWAFSVVWPVLYTMMAVAAWLVWRRRGWSAAAKPLTLFLVQLALNLFWSAVFFGLERPDAAFFEICVLCLMIVATTVAFWKVTASAGWLMMPYVLWTTFAALLNLAIWRMNV